MEEKQDSLKESCNFAGISPIMVDLPYPPIKVRGENLAFANLLSIDYCGAVSELTTIAQYINHENRLAGEKCPIARTILGIAISEMIHLQKLGQMIALLGGNIDFTAKCRNGKQKMWTPEYLNIPEHAKSMLLADIEAERAAISQYEAHIKMVKDDCVNAVLKRIIKDEEYHIMLLKVLLKELCE